MTHTARQSLRSFLIFGALAVLSLVLMIAADDRDRFYWMRLVMMLGWASFAVIYLRSWRVLRRHGDMQSAEVVRNRSND